MDERTNQIIAFIADTSSYRRDVAQIQALNANLAREFSNDFVRATRIINTSIDNIKSVEVDGNTQTIRRINTAFRDTNGTLRTYTQTVRTANGENQVLNSTLRQGAANSRSFSDNLGTLVRRAALTIPVWFALRNSIGAVFRTIRDGFQSLVDFDNALSKARRNLQGTAEQINQDFNTLRRAVEDLSLSTGESVESITNSFQRFATVGLDFETSLAGATAATQLAVSLFGDAEQNANALARAFRLLQDTSEGAAPPTEQLQQIVAQLSDLWQDNAFEINEFSAALEKFAGTARSAGLSAQQVNATLAAIQTAGVRGSTAGRLLSTAFLQLDKNFDQISQTLGLELDPALTSSFDRFLQVLGAIEQLNSVDSIAASQAIQELFGGVNATRVVNALIGLRGVLDDNLTRTGNVEDFNRAVSEVTSSLSRQLEILSQTRLAIGRAFVVGITGADDFAGSLESINNQLQAIVPSVRFAGEFIRGTFENVTFLPSLALEAIEQNAIRPLLTLPDRIRETLAQGTGNIQEEILGALRGELNASEISNLINRLTTVTGGNRGNLGAAVTNQLREIKDSLESGEITQIDLRLNAERSLQNIQQQVQDIATNAPNLTEEAEVAFQEQQDIQEQLLQNELDRLRSQGALNSEILRAESILRENLNLKEDELDVLRRQLQLERDIRNERRLGANLSSETVELFRIAQSEGTAIARTIGNVLSGDLNFDAFIASGSRAVEVFRERFASLFEQRQAERFFTRGAGQGIDIAEQGLRRGAVNTEAIEQAIRNRTVQEAVQRTNPVQQTNNVTNNINITSSDVNALAEQTAQVIINQLDNASSDISRKLNSFIENF